MIYLNSLLLLFLLLTFYRLGRIKARCARLEDKIDELSFAVDDSSRSNDQAWEAVAEGIRAIADHANKSVPIINEFISQTLCSLQYVLACVRPIMEGELEDAMEREDYRKAEGCRNMLAALDQLISPKR